jgi:hypothetical protein
MTSRDEDLGGKLAVFDPPPHDASFWQELNERLDAENARVGGRSWLRTTCAVAAAVAAVAALSLGLAGLPGANHVGPAPALAAARAVATVDAGIANIRTLQGRIVQLAPSGGETGGYLDFAVAANGDYVSDAHFTYDAAFLKNWRARARGVQGTTSTKRAARRLSTELVTAISVAADTYSARTTYLDVFSGAVVGTGYLRVVGDHMSLPSVDDLSTLEVADLWWLPTQIQIALADGDPHVTVSDTVYDGRAVTCATIQESRDAVAWRAMIDKQYGIVLAFGPAAGSRPRTGRWAYTAFRVEDLRVNRSLAARRFVLPPSFDLRPDASGGSSAGSAVNPGGRGDIAAYTERPTPQGWAMPTPIFTALARLSYDPLLPGRPLPGYAVAPYAILHELDLVLDYKRGLHGYQIQTNDAPAPAAGDREQWVALNSPIAGAVVTAVRGGAFDGCPAVVDLVRLSAPSTIDAANQGVTVQGFGETFAVQGSLTHDQALAVIAAARPRGGWTFWNRPAYQYARLLLAVTIAAVVAALTIEIAAAALVRRTGRVRRGLRLAEVVALVGCLAVALSMRAPWYALHAAVHSGSGTTLDARFGLQGASIGYAVIVLGLALLAAAVALIRAALGGWKLPVRQSLLFGLAGAAAVAFVLFVRFQQPWQARFVIGDPITAIFPRPAWGLAVGLAGALAFLLAAVLARRERA